MGEEKPRYDLALKISNALGQKLAKVFPGTAKLPFDEGDFESASNNSEALEKAGLSGSFEAHELRLELRGGAKLHLPIDDEEKSRAWSALSKATAVKPPIGIMNFR